MIRRFAIAALVALTACREGPAEYLLVQPDTLTEAGGRLTYNLLDDHAPTWNGGSDSVLYSAESYPPFPRTKGLLLTMAANGGQARPLVDAVQIGPARQPWLQAPVLSPNGSRIAFIELTDSVERFDNAICPQGVEPFSTPVLRAGVLRVRDVVGSSAADVRLPITFQGVTVDSSQHPFFLDFITIETSHPYQRHFERYRLPVFRPTWSPDGTRIAFSDGLNVRVWTVGQPSSVVVPGSADGISPAWSPDGSRIAFTKLPRGTAREFDCLVFDRSGNVVALYRRIVFGNPDRTGNLLVVNVDGSQPRDLGVGYTPAWTPDGREIVAARGGSLWRVPVDGSAPVAVPSSAIAFEPAISPDGNWLAFTREAAEDRPATDIWIAKFR